MTERETDVGLAKEVLKSTTELKKKISSSRKQPSFDFISEDSFRITASCFTYWAQLS